MKRILKVLLTMITGILLVACGGDTGGSETKSSSTEKKEIRDDFTLAMQAEPAGFNPLKTNDQISAMLNIQVYETLFIRSFDGKSYLPGLAESYTLPNETTWRIKLKEGVKFQDGTPFNSEAVKYSFERIMDPAYGSARASLAESIESIDVIDEYTLEFKTKYPDGVLLAKLSHANGAIVSPTADKTQDLMSHPVGTGPYKFVDYVSGSHINLVAYSDYREGEPSIKKVRMEIVPEISTTISKLETGEIDFFRGVSAEQVSRVKNMSNVELVGEPSGRVIYVGLRAYSSKTGTTEIPEAREAIVKSLDVEGFAATQNGLAIPSHSLVGPKVFGYTENSESYGYKYNMPEAKEIVNKYELTDKPIRILTTNTSNYSEIAEFTQASLLEAGFEDVTIEVLEYGAFLDESKKPNRMDIFMLGWSNLTGDGSELFYPNWHRDNIGGGNRSYYQNPEFEKHVMGSKTSLTTEKRLEELDKANRVIAEDVGVIPVYHAFNVYAYANDLEKISMDPGGNFYIKNIVRKR